MRKTADFLRISEVAAQLRVSGSRAYQLCAERRLPFVRRGRRILVPAAAWQRWVEEQARAALAVVEQDEG